MSDLVSNPREYFEQLVPERNNLLLELERTAQDKNIPIVGPVIGELLDILVRATRARNILELGTAIGYSAIYLCRSCPEFGGKVTTLESNPELADRAVENFQKAGLQEYIHLLNEDARRAMDKISGQSLDLIFVDIDKIYYREVLEKSKSLLRKGGLLIVDNTGFQEADEFNHIICRDPHWMQVEIYSFLPGHSPHWDGICLALRV